MIDLKNNLSILTQKLVSWVNLNGLLLNLKKTKYMIFSRKINLGNIEVTISNRKIERKSEARFLGVIVDENLKWTKHISALKSKMTKYLGIMCKLKFIIYLSKLSAIPLKFLLVCMGVRSKIKHRSTSYNTEKSSKSSDAWLCAVLL